MKRCLSGVLAMLILVAVHAGGAAFAFDPEAGPMSDERGLQQDWQTARYCGVNCLYFLSRLEGMSVEYDDVAAVTPVTDLGSSLEDLHERASRLGIPNEVAKITPETLLKLDLPVIAHITNDRDQGHYVVLLAIQDQKNPSLATVKIIDGTTCRFEQRNLGYFMRMWSGYVLLPKEGPFGQFLLRAIYVLMGLLAVALVVYALIRNRPTPIEAVATQVE